MVMKNYRLYLSIALLTLFVFTGCAGVKLNKGLSAREVIDAALSVTPACKNFDGIISVGVNNYPTVRVNLRFDETSAFFVVYGPFNMILFSASYSFKDFELFATSPNPQYKNLILSLIKQYIENIPAIFKPNIDRNKTYDMTHSNKGYLLKNENGNEILVSDNFLILKNYYNGFIFNYTYKPDTTFNEIEILPTSEEVQKYVKKISVKFETPSCSSPSLDTLLKEVK